MPGEDSAIHQGSLHHARVSRGAQWVLGQAAPQSGFRPWKQLRSFDGVGGGAGEENVAAATIELPREGVEAAHGPVGLHGVGVLFEPHHPSLRW
jgi:hypothetical protein